MAVRYPDMRVGLKEALEALVAPASQSWPGLHEGINWLDDTAPHPASESIGFVLRDADEAELVDRIHAAWDAVLQETATEGGPIASDAAHRAAPSWPQVVAAARAALHQLEAADS